MSQFHLDWKSLNVSLRPTIYYNFYGILYLYETFLVDRF